MLDLLNIIFNHEDKHMQWVLLWWFHSKLSFEAKDMDWEL